MKRWLMLVALCASSAEAFAQDAMPAAEREAYLEACLIVTEDNPDMAGYRKLGTGEVSRGHANVSMFDTQNQLVKVDCRFEPLSGGIPKASDITLTRKDGSIESLDLEMVNRLIAARMQ